MKDLSEQSVIYWRKTSLYLNITNRCCNDCLFCVRKYRTGVFGFRLKLENDPLEDDIIQELRENLSNKFEEVVFTGFGEPLERLAVVESIAKEIRKINLKIPIRLDTNGLGELINPEMNVLAILKKSGITHISISLNASNKEIYNKLCRPRFGLKSFNAIIDFAKKAKKDFVVNFTVVNVPLINIEACKRLAENLEIPLKIREYSGPKIRFN